MADPNHIAWLLEGVESWNKRGNDYLPGGFRFTPNFLDADLYDAYLEANKLDAQGNIPLSGVNLSNAILAKANLALADLSNANLQLADLSEATLWGANLTDTSLHFADLTGANLTTAELWKANLFPPGKLPKPYSDESEPIGAIADLLAIVQKLRDDYDAKTRLYFRGESECGWDLQPTVMRDDLAMYESQMLVDLMARQPEEFAGMNSALAQWVLAQHHGLRTRFLDVTKNPLVALFHASDETDQKNKKKENGRLHVFAVPSELVKPFNSDTISIIANVAKLDSSQQAAILGKRYGLLNYKVRVSTEQPQAMRILNQLIRQEKPYFEERIDPRDLYQVFIVEPQQSSERVRAQAGAFLVSAFHERFEREEILKINKGIPVYAHYKLTISGEHKDSIMRELQLLNVTLETLFPGLDSSATSVTDTYRTLFNDLSNELKDRRP